MLISSLSCPTNSSGEVQYFCLIPVPIPSPSVPALYSKSALHLQFPFAVQLPVPITTCTEFSCRAAAIPAFLHPVAFALQHFSRRTHDPLLLLSVVLASHRHSVSCVCSCSVSETDGTPQFQFPPANPAIFMLHCFLMLICIIRRILPQVMGAEGN